jgi:mannose-6-phosphate isomerase class I
LPDAKIFPALEQWVSRLREASPAEGSTEAWVLEADRLFSANAQAHRGLFFFLLLNHIVLEPGQGLFLSAGAPHAYLRGAGIEVMASSDNVLRAGLTDKHIDPRELISILRFDSRPPQILRPIPSGQGDTVYSSAAREFELHQMEVGSTASPERITSGPELLLFLAEAKAPRLEVKLPSSTLTLSQAGCCLLPHGARYRLRTTGPGRVLRVCVPSQSSLSELVRPPGSAYGS